MRPIVVLFALAMPVCAAPKNLRVTDMAVGQVGEWKTGTATFFQFTVAKVIDERTLIISLPGEPRNPVMVRGRSTAGIADGKTITLTGEWKITGTARHGERTYYVTEPAK